MKRAGDWHVGVGRRKSSVARVFVKPGEGALTINKRSAEEYFPREDHRMAFMEVLADAEKTSLVDIKINVRGGGITGQSGAIRLGIARALRQMYPELEHMLRDRGYLTRDARMVERKKYGQRGARARFQFSKR